MTSIPTPVHGGNDPDWMNYQRVGWGRALSSTTQALTGTAIEDAVCDGIAYLLHFAHAMGQDPAEELARAVRHFNAETGDGKL